MANTASTAAVSQYVEGLDFPVDKQRLIEQARSKNAPQDVMNSLNQLPDRRFNGMADLWEAMGQKQ